MTIDQFIRKWAPSDIKAIQDFQDDLYSTYRGNEYQKVALEVLTYPVNHRLTIEAYKTDSTSISYSHKDKEEEGGIQLIVPACTGITERDWLYLMQTLSSYFINQQK